MSSLLLGGLSLGSSLLGALGQHNASKAQEDALKSAQLPTMRELALHLAAPRQVGTLQPAQLETTTQGPSAFGEVPQEGRAAQLQALSELGRHASATGLLPEQRAAINDAQGELGRTARGQRLALDAQQRARGTGGSGLALALQQQAAQDAAGRAADQGFNIAAQGDQQRLAALGQLASAGGALQGQDVATTEARAQAQDAIARFNAQQLAGARQFNVAGANAAQAANLGEAQSIADQGVATRNAMEQARVDDLMRLYGAQASRGNALAQLYGQRGSQQAQQFGGIAQILGSLAGKF